MTARFIKYIILLVIFSTVSAQMVEKVQITGNEQIPNEILLSIIKSRWQTVLDTNQVKNDLKTIENYYFEEGFLEARCSFHFIKAKNSKFVSIKFVIIEGSLYSFGNIRVDGTQNLDKEFIRNLINIPSGERFSRERIVKSQLRAINTGLFSDVEIKVDDINTDTKYIDIVIMINEKKKHAANVGTGIDTEDGLKFFFEWKNRNINSKALGVGLNTLGSIDYVNDIYFKRGNIGISFVDPYIFNYPLDWRLQLSFNSDKPKYVNFGVENYSAETSFGYDISLFDNIRLKFRIQQDRLFNATFNGEHKKFINLFKKDDNRFIGLNYERDQRDDLIDPSNGLYLNLYLEKAGGFLGGNNEFYKIVMNLQNYYNVFRQFVVANKLTIGSIESHDPEAIPSYLRIFLGGSGSLRGYPERSIGPKNEDGSAQGGNFLFLNNFEIRYYFSYTFNMIVFLDAGNIWLKRDFANLNSLYYSSGIGARLRTKFGFFRLDFGLRLNEIPDKYIGKIHFGFGQTF